MHASLPSVPVLLRALLALGAGFGAGLLYFGAIWRSAQALVGGRAGLVSTLLGSLLRLALLGALLLGAVRGGALPLLAAAAGLLLARQVVLRRVRGAQPGVEGES